MASHKTMPRLTGNLTRVLAMIVVVGGFCACDSQNPADSNPSAVAGTRWVADGPAAWALHLAPKSTADADGFPVLLELVACLPPPAEDRPESERSLQWARSYSRLVTMIGDRRHWSATPTLDKEMREYGGTDILGISDGKSHVSTRELLDVGNGAKPALLALSTRGYHTEAEQLALTLFSLAGRFGRGGADRDKVVALLQVSIGTTAAEHLKAAAEARNDVDAVRRYSDIHAAIQAYGAAIVKRQRESR